MCTANTLTVIGLLQSMVNSVMTLGLLVCMVLYLDKLGPHQRLKIQGGDYLTVDLDAPVNFHGMMWGEVEWEMESFLGAPMAHGRRAQDP